MDATANSSPNPNSRTVSNRSTPVAALPIGTQLLEFTLTAVLGEGGFSIVYAAQDRRLQRVVAIKEYMPTAFSNRNANCGVELRSERHRLVFDAGMHSFIDEARLLARFKHPALVDVLRFWEANGTAYMAMPLYEGHTLRHTLKEYRGRYDENWLRSMISPILDVLEVLHGQNVYHRDVAPDNIIIQPNGSPVLLDLGSARRVLGDAEHAPTVIVKPGYTPIEQYAETSATPQGPWTDIYALGALLHFAVTGSAPAASVSRVMKDTLVPLSGQTLGGYSEGFLKGIDGALALQPKDRPQSIRELRKLLGIDRQARPMPLPNRSAAPSLPQDEVISDDAKTLILSTEEMLDLNQRPIGNAQRDNMPAPDPFLVGANQGTPSAKSNASELESQLATSIKASAGRVSVPASPPPSRVTTPPHPTITVGPTPGLRWLLVSGMSIGALLIAGAFVFWKPWGPDNASNIPSSTDASPAPATQMPTSSSTLKDELTSPATVRAEPAVSSTAVTTSPSTDTALSQENHQSHDASKAASPIESPSANARQATPPQSYLGNAQPDAREPTEDIVQLPPAHSVIPAEPLEQARVQSAPQSPQAQRERPAATRTAAASSVATSHPVTNQAPNRARPPAAASGQILTVAVTPWGEVWIDGSRRGVSPPVIKLPLRPGSYQVELRNPGFPTYRQKIQISSGQSVTLQYSFK